MTMADFIEDPQIAASIDDLKRRWPEIGAAADHPLTEWFIQRMNRNPIRDAIMSILFMIMFYGPLFVYSQFDIDDFVFFLFIVGWMFLWAIGIIRHNKKTKKSLMIPGDIYIDGSGASQAQQVWMTPLNFRAFAGIELGKMYYHEHGLKWPRSRTLLAWLGAAALSSVLVWAFQNKIAGWIDKMGGVVNSGILAICGGVLLWSLHRLHSNRAQNICAHMFVVRKYILNQQGGIVAQIKVLGLQWRLILYFVILMGNIFIVQTYKGATYWPLVDASCLLWAVAFIIRTYEYEHSDLNAHFEDFIRSTEPEFMEFVGRKIGRE